MQVNAGAQLLTFDATAAVVLADGTTCTVEAPSSLVRAKGYKQAIPDGPENYVYPIGMRLAAADGVNGYVSVLALNTRNISYQLRIILRW